MIKLASCVLALVKHHGVDENDKKVVYSLPIEIKPGSPEAQEFAERVLMPKYDRKHESP